MGSSSNSNVKVSTTYKLEVNGKNQEDQQDRARAAQVLLDNTDTDNLQFLAELSSQKGVNWKLKTFKSTIKKYLWG